MSTKYYVMSIWRSLLGEMDITPCRTVEELKEHLMACQPVSDSQEHLVLERIGDDLVIAESFSAYHDGESERHDWREYIEFEAFEQGEWKQIAERERTQASAV